MRRIVRSMAIENKLSGYSTAMSALIAMLRFLFELGKRISNAGLNPLIVPIRVRGFTGVTGLLMP